MTVIHKSSGDIRLILRTVRTGAPYLACRHYYRPDVAGDVLQTLPSLIRRVSNFFFKLDGVGLVDNRPFTNKLQHFVQK